MHSETQPDLDDYDCSDQYDDAELDADQPRPAASIQNAADARRRLEEYWAQKELEARLREIDDWDDLAEG